MRPTDPAAPPLRILVLCTGNSCRSQMVEAFLAREGGARVAVTSAGTHPDPVQPMTVEVLAERGIDWSHARSKPMRDYLETPFDAVVTVCDDANEACPVFPGGGRKLHRAFPDPAKARGTEEERRAVYRAVRDEIEAWVPGFLAEISPASS